MMNRIAGKSNSRTTAPNMTMWQYLEASNNPVVRDAMGRYKRGDIDCLGTLERIAILLLRENMILTEELQKKSVNKM